MDGQARSDGFIRLASHVTVKQILSAMISVSVSPTNAPSRFTNCSTLSRKPMIQFALKADVELGGTDRSSIC